jgi:hypothetical protein
MASGWFRLVERVPAAYERPRCIILVDDSFVVVMVVGFGKFEERGHSLAVFARATDRRTTTAFHDRRGGRSCDHLSCLSFLAITCCCVSFTHNNLLLLPLPLRCITNNLGLSFAVCGERRRHVLRLEHSRFLMMYGRQFWKRQEPHRLSAGDRLLTMHSRWHPRRSLIFTCLRLATASLNQQFLLPTFVAIFLAAAAAEGKAAATMMTRHIEL